MRDVFILYVKLPKAYSPFIRRSETPDQIGQKLRTKILEIYDKTIFAHNGWYVNNGSESIYLQQLQEIFNPITEKS